MNWRALRSAFVVASLPLGACVPKGRFDAAVALPNRARCAPPRESPQEEIIEDSSRPRRCQRPDSGR